MDLLTESMRNCSIDEQWKSKFNCDLSILATHYAKAFYESICFVPYETFDHSTKSNLIKFLNTDNNARSLLAYKIKELYPNETINIADVDSIMDYYIYSLELI